MGSVISKFLEWLDPIDKGISLSEEDVSRQLQHSRTFSWCVYRKRNLVRHVGFVIIFDENPFCTVDFAVEEPDFSCLERTCPAKVVITKVPLNFANGVDCLPAIQSLRTDTEDCREIIHKLVTPKQEKYSLLFNNCRHYTKAVLKLVCKSRKCNLASLRETKKMLQSTELEDKLALLICIQLARALGITLSSLLSTLS